MSKISSSTYNLIHGSFLLMNLIGLGWYCMEMFHLNYLIKYFSLQAFWLAIFYSLASFIKSTRQSKMAQILYELAFTTNVITSLGYWIIVRPHILDKIPNSFTLCNDFTHTMPILMLILIHYVEHLEYFHRENLKYQIYMMGFVLVVNVFFTFWQGPIYHFLTYQDIGTAIFLIGSIVMIVLIFLTMMKITTLRTKNLKKQ